MNRAHESTIRDFFAGSVPAAQLDQEWRGAFETSMGSSGTSHSRLLMASELRGETPLTSDDIVQLVDATMSGQLSLQALDAICFALEASDGFVWDNDTEDGERVSEALFLLGTPEINYPLTSAVLQKVRHYLSTGINQLGPDDLAARLPGA